MTRQLVEITLTRSGGQAWGFRILGGRDEGLLCTVEKVDNYNHYLSRRGFCWNKKYYSNIFPHFLSIIFKSTFQNYLQPPTDKCKILE